ncbi:MAG: hypothetical protein H7062_03345 [Candidatus Saccharimonas sp.]|nr:hypothetical protein [Planctomycetaceae bacterium]
MIQIHQPANNDADSVMRPRPSAQLLRRVLVRGGHSIGQHVLVAGTGCDELTDWLNALGFDVETLGDATLESAVGESHLSAFDLILVDDLEQYRANLLELSLRLVTAQLLSCLKPGGDFVVIRDAASGSIGSSTHSILHDAVCWTRHLACFPGRLETAEFPAPWFSRNTLHWLLGHGSAPAELAVSLRAPAERLTIAEWQEHARRGLLTGATFCCSAAKPDQRQRQAA